MPIKDLVERYHFGDGLPRFAIIRKGAPKPNEKQPGADLPHFRVVMQPGFERYLSVVQALFGEEPQYFTPVRFLGTTMDNVFSFWMEEHRATKMLHRCDGEQQVQWFDESTGEYCRGAAPCQRHGSPACACKPSAALNFSLPALNREIGLPGYVTLLTTSWEDVRNIMSCFKDIEGMGYANLRVVEFTIGRAPKPVNTPVPEPRKPAEIKKFRETHGGRDWKPGEKAKRVKSLIYIRVTERFSREFMLPPELEAPQLEAVTGRKIVTSDTVQSPRRIGAGGETKPSASRPNEVGQGKPGTPVTKQAEFQPPPPDIEEGDFEEDDEEAPTPAAVQAVLAWDTSPSKVGDLWQQFLKTAADKFHMSEDKVIELLTRFEQLDLGDWRSKRNIASAVLIADFQLYDPKAIGAFTSSMPKLSEASALEINDLACKIAERVKALEGDLA